MAYCTSSQNLSVANSFAHDHSTETPSPPDVSSLERTEKIRQINAACRDRDLPTLLNLATSKHGLVDDDLRRTAWPILLGCSEETSKNETPWRSLPAHRDEYQVGLDVNRAFVYYPKGESDRQLDRRKEELSNVILEVLRRHPALCYSQGYHDIVQVFLLVLGAQDAPRALTRLTLLRIRDFMLPSLDPVIAHLELLPPIIKSVDTALYEHLPRIQASFALAATLTLFAHVVQDYRDIARLFDFFLARETVIPVYLFAVIVLSRRDELLEIDDPDMLYVSLGKLPQPLDLESLVTMTVSLYQDHPPESLHDRAWRRVSSYSVLKATKTPQDVMRQTIQQAEDFFRKQEIELRRNQAITKAVTNLKTQFKVYKRPAGAISLAIAIGIYAWWLGRSGVPSHRFLGIGLLSDIIKSVMRIVA
ncbi:hypothetical protein GQ43DRAFT_416158 [Delitschia confertaspora ATCC 74209]|uniref:Rab-GAP TBC domain-containing protein n=1 Tax=Delitschia confertaspora ATCC 74209 TaxID=1513339 RepID=A0A9P4JQ84_9PLEO|nr:hypothetical protein GQ43DRAFT_416158 [Delitschia confertaspora ATCC 74209]